MLKSIIGEPKAFPSYPAALVMVGLEGVEDVLLAVDGGACPLLICHCSREERLSVNRCVTENVYLIAVLDTK